MRSLIEAVISLNILLCVGFSTFANAYVHPSFYLVRKLAKRHQSLGEARIKNRLFLLSSDGKTEATYIETIAISETGKVQVRIATEDGAKSIVRERKSVFHDLKRPFTYDLLFVPSEESIYERFTQLGFPLKSETELYAEQSPNTPYNAEFTIGLTRDENKIVQFLANSLTRGPQLYFEKDSALPLKAILPEGFGRVLEIKLSRYTELAGKQGVFLYPSLQHVSRGGESWIRLEFLEAKFGPGASQLDHLKGKVEELSDGFLSTYFEIIR